MGLSWDKAVPSVEIWAECLRVLKPGGFAFVFSSPRLDCLVQMGANLGQAGFRIRFTPIFWVFSQGFNKGSAMDKRIDDRFGAERKVVGRNPTWREAKRSNKVYGSVDGGSAENMTEPSTDEAKYYDGSHAGFQPKPAVEPILVCMKPLSEKTYVDQALEHHRQRQDGETTVGPGVTWLDDGRIPPTVPYRIENYPSSGPGGSFALRQGTHRGEKHEGRMSSGRFAPNLLVEDDALNDGTITGAGITGSGVSVGRNRHGKSTNTVYRNREVDKTDQGFPDFGSISRYFDLDAWFAERLKDFPKSVQKTFPFLHASKPSKPEKKKGCDGIWVLKEEVPEKISSQLAKILRRTPGRHWWVGRKMWNKMPKKVRKWYLKGNAHVTVKPLKIMTYLIEIGSRRGDLILDPFAGSGTTGVAAILRGRRPVMIERDPRWAEISRRRMRATAKPLFARKIPG